MDDNKVVLFQEKQIRRVWHEDQWFFAVVDAIETLTDSDKPRDYWYRLKKREAESSGFQLSTICRQLKLASSDGKKYTTECANTEGLFRIIMAIPSPKAEPFKLWLAQVGKEQLDEIQNPELAADRARSLYRAKGYPADWIEMRMKTIEVRQQLTDEWKNRDVQEGAEYAILTAEIAKATFGLTPTEHKEVKGLQRENLRDHMTNLELIFTMLGEESTRQYAIEDNAKGFPENKKSAQKGGKSAGKSRQAYEKESGKKVVTPANFKNRLSDPEPTKTID